MKHASWFSLVVQGIVSKPQEAWVEERCINGELYLHVNCAKCDERRLVGKKGVVYHALALIVQIRGLEHGILLKLDPVIGTGPEGE